MATCQSDESRFRRPAKGTLVSQKSVIQLLDSNKNRAREKYYEYGLHIRVRDISSITNKTELSHEKFRHGRIVHELRNLNDSVRSILRKMTNGNNLLDIYNSVDLRQENKTPANIMELRLKNIDSIIKLVENDPDKYASDSPLISHDVRYSKATGIILQGIHKFVLKDDAKKLIDYLWGKRKVSYLDKSPTTAGRSLSNRSVLVNCNVIESKLTNIIDNFNQQMKKDAHPIDARIRRKDGLIQLEISNEHPASK